MSDQIVLSISLLAGIIPALIWLFFWLKEDSAHPEPRRLILLSFLLGMVAVVVVIPIQQFFKDFFFGEIDLMSSLEKISWGIGIMVFVWAGIEELGKYLAAHFGGLRQRDNDEPIDPIIYLISAALGFAALENSMFLFTPFLEGNITVGILTGNIRFIGATLLHVASSALVGIAIAKSFYNREKIRRRNIWIGLLLATLLHGAFNLFIIIGNVPLYLIYGFVWLVIIIIILIIEKTKKCEKDHSLKN